MPTVTRPTGRGLCFFNATCDILLFTNPLLSALQTHAFPTSHVTFLTSSCNKAFCGDQPCGDALNIYLSEKFLSFCHQSFISFYPEYPFPVRCDVREHNIGINTTCDCITQHIQPWSWNYRQFPEALGVNALLDKTDCHTRSPGMFQTEWAVRAEIA
jgi:hypothetical protein